MNKKFCDVGRHIVDKLWKARTKSQPSCCRTCLYKLKSETTSDDNPKSDRKYPEKKKKAYIKPFSDKHLEDLAKYRPLRDEFLEKNKVCQIKAPGCTHAATQVHHAKPRRYYLCDVSIFVASCTNCNMYVENHDSWARERGFKLDHLGDKSNK